MYRDDGRWSTSFGRWVRDYGVEQLKDQLGSRGFKVAQSTIYGWVGAESAPRPRHARAIVDISGGHITRDDLDEHWDALAPPERR